MYRNAVCQLTIGVGDAHFRRRQAQLPAGATLGLYYREASVCRQKYPARQRQKPQRRHGKLCVPVIAPAAPSCVM